MTCEMEWGGSMRARCGCIRGGILFIAPSLRGVPDDFGLANPSRPNRVLMRRDRHAPPTKTSTRLLIWGYRVLREVHACCFIMDQSMG